MPRLKRKSVEMRVAEATERRRRKREKEAEENYWRGYQLVQHHQGEEEEGEVVMVEPGSVQQSSSSSSSMPVEVIINSSEVFGNAEMELTNEHDDGAGGDHFDMFGLEEIAVVKVERGVVLEVEDADNSEDNDDPEDVEEECQEAGGVGREVEVESGSENEEHILCLDDQRDLPEIGGAPPAVRVSTTTDLEVGAQGAGEEVGSEQECLICGNLLLEEREMGGLSQRRRLNFEGGSGGGGPLDCDQLKAQLWSVFVLRSVLKFPQEECARLLKVSYGLNPTDWFDLCGECSGVVEAVLEMQEQVRVLEGKMKGLSAELKGKLEGNLKRGVDKGPRDLEVGVLQTRDEIRKYFKGQLDLPKPKPQGQAIPRQRRKRSFNNANAARRIRHAVKSDDGSSGTSSDSSVDSDYSIHPDNNDPLWSDADSISSNDDVAKVIEHRRNNKKNDGRSRITTTTTTRRATKKRSNNNPGRRGGGGGLGKSGSKIGSGGNQNGFVCEECGKDFKRRCDLSQHRAKKHRIKTGLPEPDPNSSNHVCSLCDLPYSNYKALRSHMWKYHPNGEPAVPEIQCEHCDAKLLNFYAVGIHNRKEHPELYSYSCDLCDFVCTTTGQKAIHKRMKHNRAGGGPPKDQCPYCKRSYRYPGIYSHKKICPKRVGAHRGDNFQCEQCDSKFDNQLKLDWHVRAKHEKALKSCRLCEKEVRLSSYRSHLIACTKRQKRMGSAGRKSGGGADRVAGVTFDGCQFICDKCDYSTDHKSRWNIHAEKHKYDDQMEPLPSGALQCKVCSAVFSMKFQMQTHLREAHHAELGLPLHQCAQCGKIFGNGRTLAQHRRTVHNEERKERPVELHNATPPAASSDTTTPTGPTAGSSSSTTTYNCDICGLCFSAKYLLGKHNRIFHQIYEVGPKKGGGGGGAAKKPVDRSNRPAIKCKFCDATFVNHYAIRLHYPAAHYDQLKFKCDLCSYACDNPSAMSQHKKAKHQVGGRIKCPYCAGDYGPTSIYQHKTACRKKLGIEKEVVAVAKTPHQPKKVVQCEHCESTFANAYAANEHKRAAHLELYAYRCDECDYVAIKHGYVVQHKRFVHRGATRICPYCSLEIRYSYFYQHKIACRKKLGIKDEEEEEEEDPDPADDVDDNNTMS